MKKLFLLSLLAFFVLSCSDSKESPSPSDGKGNLTVKTGLNTGVDMIVPRDGESIIGYTLTITGENTSHTQSLEITQEGNVTMEEIPAGSYEVVLTSHPTGFPVPGFDIPVYTAKQTGVEITSGNTTQISLECTQENTGIYFVFDQSLQDVGGFSNVIPAVTDSQGRSLVFSDRSQVEKEGETRLLSSTGHFAPGDVKITVKDGDSPISIGGTLSETITFESKQLWEVVLKVTPSAGNGKLSLSAIVTVITDPTNVKEFEIGAAPTRSYTLSPAIDEQAAYADTYLDLTFGTAPVLGATGTIAIYKMDGTKVDEIKMEDPFLGSKGLYNSTKIDIIGLPTTGNSNRLRMVNYYPVTVSGNTVRIKPHYAVLEYDTEYYVTVDESVIAGDGFNGIAAGEWTFKTKSNAPSLSATTLTVDDDGVADFRTVQAAIDYAAKIGKDTKVTIEIRNGIYEELLYVRGKNNLTLRGESRDGVIIRYDNCDALNPGVGGTAVRPEFGAGNITDGGRPLFLIESAGGLRLENLTIENTHVKTGNGDQAEAVYFNSTNSTLVFVNCNLLSRQDTINIKGYCWFYNSLIAGDVDFIWGGPVVALFEGCEIRSVSSGGYILQARVPSQNEKGFVFLGCELTKSAGVETGTTFLARSGYSTTYYDNIAMVNCKMDTHISSAGWRTDAGKSPNPAVADINNGWKEYGSMDMTGAPLNVSGRTADVQYQMTQQEYKEGYADRAKIMEAFVTNTGKDLSWLSL